MRIRSDAQLFSPSLWLDSTEMRFLPFANFPLSRLSPPPSSCHSVDTVTKSRFSTRSLAGVTSCLALPALSTKLSEAKYGGIRIRRDRAAS